MKILYSIRKLKWLFVWILQRGGFLIIALSKGVKNKLSKFDNKIKTSLYKKITKLRSKELPKNITKANNSKL